jgi:hypothetical protein
METGSYAFSRAREEKCLVAVTTDWTPCVHGLVCRPLRGQQNGAPLDQREVLEQILTHTHYPSIVGKHAMGIGSATEVRRAEIFIVVQRPGLAASVDRAPSFLFLAPAKATVSNAI